jgi:predicted transcriptional regulator YheO
MTEHESIIENLKSLADGVVSLFGRNCEACVHDLTSLQNSLIYIQGDVTHRKPGAPATDLLVRLIEGAESGAKNMHNYKTTTREGKSLKSTTTIIRDSSDTPVAAFCINFDTSTFFNAYQAFLPFLDIHENDTHQNNETFTHSVNETVGALFMQAAGEVGRHPTTMNIDEKTELFRRLEESGTFKLKGAVEEVAALMGVTKFTVYNYLKRINGSDNKIQHKV